MSENNAQRRRLSGFWWFPPVIAGIGAATLLLLGAAHAPRWHETARSASPDTTQPPSEPKLQPLAPVRAPDLDPTTMGRLHELVERDPAAALSLALQSNARFPNSAAAPERGWIICRCLVELRRFPEAVAEARVVVEQYPNTSWALDVARHLLVNPMSDPSERGYGRASELE